MTDEQLQLAQMQIDALNQNDKKCLKEIYGDIWGQINNPTEFGKKYNVPLCQDHLIQHSYFTHYATFSNSCFLNSKLFMKVS